MIRRCAVAAVSLAAAVTLGGCGLPDLGARKKAASAAGVPSDGASPGGGAGPAGVPGDGAGPAGVPGGGVAPAGVPGGGVAPAGVPGDGAAPASGGTGAATGDGARPTPGGSAVSKLGSARNEGAIPDPCTVLSRAEVVHLTDRPITQVDTDGAQPGDPSRYCQWQQETGQLALFLSRTTDEEFHTVIAGATPVDGVGEDAFELAGHLYVLYGTVQIDVYSRGGSETQNLTDAKEVATMVIPRI